MAVAGISGTKELNEAPVMMKTYRNLWIIEE